MPRECRLSALVGVLALFVSCAAPGAPAYSSPKKKASAKTDAPPASANEEVWESLEWRAVKNSVVLKLRRDGSRVSGKFMALMWNAEWDVEGTFDATGKMSLVRYLPTSEFKTSNVPDSVLEELVRKLGDGGRKGFVAAPVTVTYEKVRGVLKGTYTRVSWKREQAKLLSAEFVPQDLMLVRRATPKDRPTLSGTWKFKGGSVTLTLKSEGAYLRGRFSSPRGRSWEVEGKERTDGTLLLARFVAVSELSGTPEGVKREFVKQYGARSREGFVRGTVYLRGDPDSGELIGYYGQPAVEHEEGRFRRGYEQFTPLHLVPLR